MDEKKTDVVRERIKLSQEQILSRMNAICPGTLMETLGIRYTAVGEDWIACTMKVTQLHLRTEGFLQGGATMALLETAGSSGSYLFLDPEREIVLGIDVSASHLSPGREGDLLTATARAVHVGRTTQLWQVEIRAQDGRLVSVGKVTNVILPKSAAEGALKKTE